MDIEDFVNNAIKQVRDAKKQGKAGRSARKELAKGQAAFEKAKAEIKEMARSLEKREWRETALVMFKAVATCNCCGDEKEVCTEGVYLEKTHRRLGKIMTKIESPNAFMYPSLPRRIETMENKNYICADCFLSSDTRQLQLPGMLHDTIRDCKQIPEKQLALYHAEAKRYTEMCWRKLLPKTLPLLPSPETI